MKPRRTLPLLVLALAVTVGAEIIDRIAVTLGSEVISLSQISQDIRLTAFLNQETPDFSPAARRRSAERLVEQFLLRREMTLNQFVPPKPENIAPLWKQLRDKFTGDAALKEALAKADLTEDEVRQRLLWELTAVDFVDYRFRAGIQVPEEDISDYYQKRASEWKAKGVSPIPTLEQSRAEIETILEKERANQALDLWLGDARTQMDISYRADAFR